MLYFCTGRSFYLSYFSLLRPLVPSLLVAELVGADPVQGVRHAHHDRPSGHVALDPGYAVLVLHHVLDPVAVQLRVLQPHQLHDDCPCEPCIPWARLQTLKVRVMILGS